MNVQCETEDCGSSSGVDSFNILDDKLSVLETDVRITMPKKSNDDLLEVANANQTRTYQHNSSGTSGTSTSRSSRRCHTKGKQKYTQSQPQLSAGSHLHENHDVEYSNDLNGDGNTISKFSSNTKCISNNAITNDKWKSETTNCNNDSTYTELSKQSMAANNGSEMNTSHISETEYEQNHDYKHDNDKENDNDDWEKMFDESGECLDDKVHKLTTSLKKNLQIGQNHQSPTAIKNLVTSSHNTCHTVQEKVVGDKEDTEFSHVLEVSNFPVEFRTQDLFMIFSQYKESGFDIKWVDDTHALLVFSSSHIANEVLNAGHPLVILKPLKGATVESKLKAKKCALYIQPYRPRPETCVALARRLVTGALGVRLKTAAIERENEKRILNQARERKMQALQQQQKQRDNWDS